METFAGSKFEEVDDERVQHLHLAVGTRMQQNVGLQEDGTFAKVGYYNELGDMYKRYHSGQVLNDAEHVDFQEQSMTLMRDTIRGATALCATVAGAADIDVTESYGSKAELIVVDEAARVKEYEWWPLLIFYPNAIGKIMIGDRAQLQPFVGRNEKDNPFRAQIRVSLMHRIQFEVGKHKLRRWSAFFTEQYRAVPEIAQVYNLACYGGRIKSSVSLDDGDRDVARAIIKHNGATYGGNFAHSVLAVDLPGARNQQDRSSRYCDESAAVIIKILEELFMDDFGTEIKCSIAILVPYHAQRRRLKYALKKMCDEYPEAANVVLETGDKVQGREYNIVLVDPVVTASPGFLDQNRLNVLFSRARDGLYVVGNFDRWQMMYKDDSVPLKDFGRELTKFRMPWAGTRQSRFYDPSTFDHKAQSSDNSD